MKEVKVYFKRISSDISKYAQLLNYYQDFIDNDCAITKHAYDMHADLSLENVGHSEKVSYFKGGAKMMTKVIFRIIADAQIGIINFMEDSRETSLEIERTFKKVIGYVVTDDEIVETNTVRVVICKGFNGLYTKTAYPILREV